MDPNEKEGRGAGAAGGEQSSEPDNKMSSTSIETSDAYQTLGEKQHHPEGIFYMPYEKYETDGADSGGSGGDGMSDDTPDDGSGTGGGGDGSSDSDESGSSQTVPLNRLLLSCVWVRSTSLEQVRSAPRPRS